MILNEFWVLVHRHQEPEHDAWGIHHFVMVKSPEKDGHRGAYVRPFGWNRGRDEQAGALYRATTVGLFSSPIARHTLGQIHRAIPGLANAPVPPELQSYVYYQVAPREWHKDLSNGVQAVCDRLSILARREHPTPVSVFAGASGASR